MNDENKQIIKGVIDSMINLQILSEKKEAINFETSLEVLIAALKYTLNDHQ